MWCGEQVGLSGDNAESFVVAASYLYVDSEVNAM